METIILLITLTCTDQCITLSKKVENTITKCIYKRIDWNSSIPTFPCENFNKEKARNSVYSCLKICKKT